MQRTININDYHPLYIVSLEYSRHGSIASRDLPVPGLTRLGVNKVEDPDIDVAFSKYSGGVHSSNGDDDNDVPSSPDSDSGGLYIAN